MAGLKIKLQVEINWTFIVIFGCYLVIRRNHDIGLIRIFHMMKIFIVQIPEINQGITVAFTKWYQF